MQRNFIPFHDGACDWNFSNSFTPPLVNLRAKNTHYALNLRVEYPLRQIIISLKFWKYNKWAWSILYPLYRFSNQQKKADNWIMETCLCLRNHKITIIIIIYYIWQNFFFLIIAFVEANSSHCSNLCKLISVLSKLLAFHDSLSIEINSVSVHFNFKCFYSCCIFLLNRSGTKMTTGGQDLLAKIN